MGASSKICYESYISLSLYCISKENELGFNMINENRDFVRKGIGRNWILYIIQTLKIVILILI